ncbi:MAG: valine--tRNA ligase [Patescibacteria group bacterium]|jgi:valyl-tRNA synthetase
MNKELPKVYDPQKYEDDIYKKWEDSGFFNPDVCVDKGVCEKDAETYTIVLPPPNITDKLHLGHVVMVAISDILIRYNRMNGKRALWIPGTDHAAIATQNVVEKKILKEQKKSRHDLGREKFLDEVNKFVKETQATIIHQLKKTGASLDWSREAFTLDEQRQKAVKQMFVDMYEAGAIYQGHRIVNWCPRCQSTLADDEVEHKEQDAKFYTFKYSKDFPFAISTTRPETKLGDTAVAVNPDDKRYKKYIGQELEVNFCGMPLKLKIIADDNVDSEFGTGALGVTPAHSMVDYEMAQKNNLEIKKVIDEQGKIIEGLSEFGGKRVKEARKMIIEKLTEQNLLEKEEDIKNNLAICYRCGTAIEPLTSKQWFVSVDKKLKKLGNKSLKEKAIEVAKKGEINFVPERFSKRYLDWMENLHDWCISRQIWFGHQIPVWYKGDEIYVGAEKPSGAGWTQDEDVLDTWFSSGMWTFSTLGWPFSAKAMAGKPNKTDDLKTYHPTQVLETGYEIITLWVSRMIMMSLFAVDQIPFENVYLHGMVLDAKGKKMSKSKGNGIDPLEMIEKYGTDAVRMSLIINNTPGNDMKMSEQKIAEFRNFANKLWNIARYAITNYEPCLPAGRLGITNYKIERSECTLADRWILDKMHNLVKEVTQDIEEFKFSQAGEMLRDFTWNDFADWYLEISKFEKTENKNKILMKVLQDLLKLWHPFMPFVTEAIWGELGNDVSNKEFLMVNSWPTFVKDTAGKPENEKDFDLVRDIITAIRQIKSTNKIPPKEKIKAVIYAGDKVELIESQAELIKSLRTGVEELEIKPSLADGRAGKEKSEAPADAKFSKIDDIKIYILKN